MTSIKKSLNKDLKEYKYIDVDDLVQQAYLKLTYNKIKVTREQVAEMFKFQFYMMRIKQKENEYIKLPVIGSFYIKNWKFVLENERILFGVKNPKSIYTKEGDKIIYPVKLKGPHVDYNYLIYDKMRNEHTTFTDIDLYQQETISLYEKYKDSIISIELLKKADICSDTNNLVRRMLYSKREESKSWYKNRNDRRYKIEHHMIEGYETRLQKFKNKYKQLLDEKNSRRS